MSNPTRREFLKTIGFAAASTGMLSILPCCAGVSQATAAQRKRPNVILVMTDDQGYGDIGIHGNIMINTPHLDKLHDQCVRLTDFHVSPCCTPTRASLMTGCDAVRTGAWGTTWGRSLPKKELVMMADVFAASGYHTAFFGKWHLGDSYPFRPEDRGFQDVLYHGGGGVGQTPDYWGNDYFDDTYFHNDKPEKFKGYCTDIWFDGALEFIKANKEQSFFVYLSTNAPHGPLNVDPKYSEPYEAKGVRQAMSKFYGMIENIDENMGRLMSKLEEWELAENTILIFMTDNGTAGGFVPKGALKKKTASKNGWTGFNAGMHGKKGSLYEGGHRVPFFIRWPAGGLVGGCDMNKLSAHIDVLPTLIDLCGLDSPRGAKFDGTSLSPLLTGKAAKWPDRTLFVQYRQSHKPPEKYKAAVLSQRWRLVGDKQLYDIQADPGQQNNVADKHPDVVEQLHKAYEKWWAEVSKGFDEYSRIILGSEAANPTRLTGFDWVCDKSPWNQTAIRRGVLVNSFWAVEVARDGMYEFSLRRWPEEINAPITRAVERGHPIAATSARLTIGEVDLAQPIPDGAVDVTFRVPLKRGKAKLQTWLIDEPSGESRGAYYVYVKRL